MVSGPATPDQLAVPSKDETDLEDSMWQVIRDPRV